MSLISVASVLGFLVVFIDCVTLLDYFPLGGRISPKAQYFKEFIFINRIVSYSSLFQRDLRARTGSCHRCQHFFF